MKKITITFALATALAVILSPVSVFAAANAEAGSLSSAQIIAGIAILITAITIPIIKWAHKSKLNK
jgi:predicted transporter